VAESRHIVTEMSLERFIRERILRCTWQPKAHHRGPGKQRVGGPIRSGNLAFGSIGGWYPERRPEGPGDALEMMKEKPGIA